MGEVKRDAEADDAPTVRPCRCVILTPRALPRPIRLIVGLEERGAQLTIVHDAPSLMVELAGGAHLAIINEPRTARRLDELLAAVERYYPRTPCWQFESIGRDHPRLLRIDSGAFSQGVDDGDATGTEASHPPDDNGLPPDSGSIHGGLTSDERIRRSGENDASGDARATDADHDAHGEPRVAESFESHAADAAKRDGPQPTARSRQGVERGQGRAATGPGDPLVTIEELAMLLKPLEPERDDEGGNGHGRRGPTADDDDATEGEERDA